MDTLLKMLVQDYLAGNKPLGRLQSHLVDLTWDMRGQISPECLRLTDGLNLLIDEFTGGYLSESQLRAGIQELSVPHFSALQRPREAENRK
jgi:hypothetical protein